MNTSNVKDTVTNVAKWMITIGTFLIGLPVAILSLVPDFPLSLKFKNSIFLFLSFYIIRDQPGEKDCSLRDSRQAP